MSRMFLTNNIDTIDIIKIANKDALLNVSFCIEDPFYICNYMKRIKPITNYYRSDFGDFCMISGTLVYRGNIGREALRSLLEEFNGDVDSVRQKILGNYMCVIKKNSETYVFTDKYQIYHVYYCIDSKFWFISNTFENVCLSKNKIKINEYSLLLEAFQCGTVGNDTPVSGIFRLMGYEFLYIDKNNSCTVRRIPYCRKHWKMNDEEECANQYVKMIHEQFALVNRIFGKEISVNMTGGLDSRIVFYSFVNAGVIPNLVYGEGNSSITGTENGDYKIVEQFASKYKTNKYIMNWKADYLHNFLNWDSLFKTYGFLYKFYGANINFFNEYNGKIDPYPAFMESGHYGEPLRAREWMMMEYGKESIDIDEFISKYQMRGVHSKHIINERMYPNSAGLQDYLKECFIREADIHGIDISNGITVDKFEEFRYLQHRLADSYLVNLFNEFTASISMFGTEQLCEFPFDIPYSWRKNGHFQMKVILKLNSSGLDIPIMSHRYMQTVDLNSLEMRQQLSSYEKMGKVLRNILGRESRAYLVISKFKNIIFSKSEHVVRDVKSLNEKAELIPQIIEQIKKDQDIVGVYINPENVDYGESLIHFMYYALLIHGIVQALRIKKNKQEEK